MNQIEFTMHVLDPKLAAECTQRTFRGLMHGCKGCGACCGRVLPMTKHEQRIIKKHVADNGVTPKKNEYAYCALLDMESGLCMAYDARPTICRIWCSPNDADVVGTRPRQPCGADAKRIGEFARIYHDIEQVDTYRLFGLE